MNKKIKNIFIYLAQEAMDKNKEVRLEWKDYHSNSKALNGVIMDDKSRDNGLVLSIHNPEEGKEE